MSDVTVDVAGFFRDMFVESGDAVFFRAATSTSSFELWSTDGTPLNTAPVVPPGTAPFNPDWLTDANDELLFIATDWVHGDELWRTDGTPEGTRLVKDILPGERGSSATFLTAVGDRVYFIADDGVHGRELWTSDGTADGTSLIADLTPGGSSGVYDLTPFSSKLYFFKEDESFVSSLWETDGKAAGTRLIAAGLSRAEHLTVAGDSVFFVARDEAHGDEIWLSDGTTSGTRLAADLDPGPFGIGIQWMVELDGSVIVATRSNLLARVDETGGTLLHSGLSQFTPSSREVARVGEALLFAASASSAGSELWRTDGTPEGTFELIELNPAYAGSYPSGFINVAGGTLFAADPDGEEYRIWFSDGTKERTLPLEGFDGLSDFPRRAIGPLVGALNHVFFPVRDTALGNALWVLRVDSSNPPGIRGGIAGQLVDDTDLLSPFLTIEVSDNSIPADELSMEVRFDPWDGAFTSASLMAGGWEPLGRGAIRLKGTALELQGALRALVFQPQENRFLAGASAEATFTLIVADPLMPPIIDRTTTIRVRSINDSPSLSGANRLAPVTVGEVANPGTLVRSLVEGDVRDDDAGSQFGIAIVGAQTELGDWEYSLAGGHGPWLPIGAVGANRARLLRADSQTRIRFVPAPGSILTPVSYASLSIRAWDGTDDQPNGALVEIDGGGGGSPFSMETARPIVAVVAWDVADGPLVRDIMPGTEGSNPEGFVELGGITYFAATDAIAGRELWRTDGTYGGTYLVSDINPGAAWSSPTSLTAMNGRLYFAAEHPIFGRELWSSDGTAEGTSLVGDLVPGPSGANPERVTSAGKHVYFTTNDGSGNKALWASDGTERGTERLTDAWHMDRDRLLFPLGEKMLFQTDRIWISNGSRAGTMPISHERFIASGVSNLDGTIVIHHRLTDGTHVLWTTDGTLEATEVLSKAKLDELSARLEAGYIDRNGFLWFNDRDRGEIAFLGATVPRLGERFLVASGGGGEGTELWIDFAIAEDIVVDIWPGHSAESPNSSFPREFTAVHESFYFTAADGFSGRELWRTDATPAGTYAAAHIVVGRVGSDPLSLTNVHGMVYFSAQDDVHGRELYLLNDDLVVAPPTASIGAYSPEGAGFFLADELTHVVADRTYQFGPADSNWVPLAGDWDGDGSDTAGLYDPATGAFFIRNDHGGGTAHSVFVYGPAGKDLSPLAGDWNGDGRDSVGLFDPIRGAFYLKDDNSPGAADATFQFGPGARLSTAIVGDWDANGRDTIGIYSSVDGAFFLRNDLAGGGADAAFQFGPPNAGWQALAGDWNGDGQSTVALYAPKSATFFLSNDHVSGEAAYTTSFGPANAGWIPLAGDWSGDAGGASMSEFAVSEPSVTEHDSDDGERSDDIERAAWAAFAALSEDRSAPGASEERTTGWRLTE